jgi:hypothetical protein
MIIVAYRLSLATDNRLFEQLFELLRDPFTYSGHRYN